MNAIIIGILLPLLGMMLGSAFVFVMMMVMDVVLW